MKFKQEVNRIFQQLEDGAIMFHECVNKICVLAVEASASVEYEQSEKEAKQYEQLRQN